MNTIVLQRLICDGSRKLLLCTLFLALAAGCATTPPQNVRPASIETASPVSASVQAATTGRPIEDRLRAQVHTWRKTPHKMGGTSRRGVDCSGFVQQLYQDLFRRPIPRTTALQVKSGQPVELSGLSPGDLVFFKPPDKIRHVGIYLGRGEFAHASSSKGVIISSLSEDYWHRCYWTARRYLGPFPDPYAAKR